MVVYYFSEILWFFSPRKIKIKITAVIYSGIVL